MSDILLPYCVFSLIIFVGLFLFCILSGKHIPVLGMIGATLVGVLVFQVTGWLVWNVMAREGYGLHGYLPHLATMIVMVLMIWKWPKADLSLGKSLVAVCSQIFLLILALGVIMALAAGEAIFLVPVGVVLVIMVVIWKM